MERLNSLEKLSQIAKKGEKISAEEVNTAYEKSKLDIKKSYTTLKKPKKGNLGVENDKLDALRDKMLQDVEGSQSLYKTVRSGIVDSTKTLLDTKDAIFGDEYQTFQTYRKYIHAKTDPDGEDAIIEDYEGWGGIGKSGMEDGNFNNGPRWLLSGYLLGLQIDDHKAAEEGMEEAHEIYENSGGMLGDNVFTTEHLMNEMALEGYIQDVEKYNLANEPTGLLVGYLKLASKLEPEKKEAYREYFFKKLDMLMEAEKFRYEPQKNESEMMFDYNKGEFQLGVLEKELKSPRQFDESVTLAKEGPREERIATTVDKVAAFAATTAINPAKGLETLYDSVFSDGEEVKKQPRAKKTKHTPNSEASA